MQKSIIRGLLMASAGLALAAGSTSCTKDLDQEPRFELTPDKVYANAQGYRQVLAKLYAGFATTGQQGPAGKEDIGGIDEGTSDYIRQYWSAQELSTDEAVVAWNDPGVQDWHNMNWSAANSLTRGLYSRIFYEVSICNEFLRESTDDKLGKRLSADEAATVRKYRAEARFLRAVAYMHAMDLYGNGPFVTESDPVGFFQPPYYTRSQYFTFVEKELMELGEDANFADARTNEYGRVDKAAAWGMLARLYLNAQVYTGTARYNDAAIQAKRVIDAGYKLTEAAPGKVASAYGSVFLGDNNTSAARNEVIWPVVFDVNTTQSYGGTTFLVNGSTGSSAAWQRKVGQTTGWQGLRTTSAFFKLFPDTALDRRGRFWTEGQTLQINDLGQFNQGLGVLKFRNVNSKGDALGGSQNFSSVDFPMIRVAEMMLIYAEAVTRGGAGDANLALGYVNQIRRRAFGLPTSTPSAVADVTSQVLKEPTFLLDERGRELHWEGHRRTDLIRYGRFTTNAYLWPWKGGVASGRAVEDFRRLYPIPAADLAVNQNLKQNEGY
ncbi:RagB/SusD family nutrient uptake outer membrane protein [Hymenobacter actinosclerus]|uniref:Starch-binding associating with outer membrane n=1 Tax=Hymenobacter actinosclerus TaxID=82805 RepID=A0A1I0BZU9_9BACT|nr:RagB/SusD family nutrient uptake outer membrane protein [Hymenobacter actinosclerus]SET12596.1 Starch-binding associating with outer membrane [Hymenobacter actinosclerus]